MTRAFNVFALAIALAAIPRVGRAGEIAPRDITQNSSGYEVTLHVADVQDATSKFASLKKDAESAIGDIVSTESLSMPRDDGKGYDVTYRFRK